MTDELHSPPDGTTSRRTLLKGAAVGAGAVLVAPSVLTLSATPAAASPAGCNACSQNMMIGTTTPGTGQNFGDGTAAALAGWTSVSGVSSTGSVFQGTTTGTNTATFTRDFSAACTARFGTQTPVPFTFSGTLTAGHQSSPSSLTLRFYSGPNATGSILYTETLTGAGGSSSFTIPSGTSSMRVVMTLGATNNGGQQGGTADNIAVQLGIC